MTHAHEAVKTRHKESSLIFPIMALAILFFWGEQCVIASGYCDKRNGARRYSQQCL